jgi:hypothetical protein
MCFRNLRVQGYANPARIHPGAGRVIGYLSIRLHKNRSKLLQHLDRIDLYFAIHGCFRMGIWI